MEGLVSEEPSEWLKKLEDEDDVEPGEVKSVNKTINGLCVLALYY